MMCYQVDAGLIIQEVESPVQISTAELLEGEDQPGAFVSGLREEPLNDEVEDIDPETGCPGNGVGCRSPEPSSLSPVAAINVKQRKLTPVMSNALPPIEKIC